MAHDVFISCCEKDRQIAYLTCRKLEENGISCYLASRDSVPGTDGALSEDFAIQSAKIMVVIFTETANNSPKIAGQLSKAVPNNLTIFPLKLTQSPLSDSMQFYLSTVHWLEGEKENLDVSLNVLVMECRAILSGGENDKTAKKGRREDGSSGRGKKRGAKRVLSVLYIAMFLLGVFYLFITLADAGGRNKDLASDIVLVAILVFPFLHSLAKINEKYNRLTSKLKYPLLIIEVVLIVVFIVLAVISGNTNLIEITEVDDEQTANSLNGGYVTVCGDTVYYSGSSDGEGLFEVSLEGFKNGETGVKILDGKIAHICFSDGVLFFTKSTDTADNHLFRYDPESQLLEKVHDAKVSQTLAQTGFILYENCSSKNLGDVRYILSDGSYSDQIGYQLSVKNILVYDGKVYLRNRSGQITYQSPVKHPEDVTNCPNVFADSFTALNGCFYLMHAHEGGIEVLDTQSFEITPICDIAASQMVYYGGRIYFLGTGDGKLYSMDEVTGDNLIAHDEEGLYESIIESDIFYTDLNIADDTLYLHSYLGSFMRIPISSLQGAEITDKAG